MSANALHTASEYSSEKQAQKLVRAYDSPRDFYENFLGTFTDRGAHTSGRVSDERINPRLKRGLWLSAGLSLVTLGFIIQRNHTQIWTVFSRPARFIWAWRCW